MSLQTECPDKGGGAEAPLSQRLQSARCQAACWAPLSHWMSKALIKGWETSHALPFSSPPLAAALPFPLTCLETDTHTHSHLSFLRFISSETDEFTSIVLDVLTETNQSQDNCIYFKIYYFDSNKVVFHVLKHSNKEICRYLFTCNASCELLSV